MASGKVTQQSLHKFIADRSSIKAGKMNEDSITLTDAPGDPQLLPTTLPEIEAKITALQTELRKMAERGTQLDQQVKDSGFKRLKAAGKVAQRGPHDEEAQNEYAEAYQRWVQARATREALRTEFDNTNEQLGAL